MVSLEEWSIIIPILSTIFVPIIILGLTRYLRSSESLTRSSVVYQTAIEDLEAYVKNHKKEYREIWNKLGEIDKSVYNITWRLNKVEEQHERARYD